MNGLSTVLREEMSVRAELSYGTWGQSRAESQGGVSAQSCGLLILILNT